MDISDGNDDTKNSAEHQDELKTYEIACRLPLVVTDPYEGIT
jgi:hypothetical protein